MRQLSVAQCCLGPATDFKLSAALEERGVVGIMRPLYSIALDKNKEEEERRKWRKGVGTEGEEEKEELEN
jgi:hypothetical protein